MSTDYEYALQVEIERLIEQRKALKRKLRLANIFAEALDARDETHLKYLKGMSKTAEDNYTYACNKYEEAKKAFYAIRPNKKKKTKELGVPNNDKILEQMEKEALELIASTPPPPPDNPYKDECPNCGSEDTEPSDPLFRKENGLTFCTDCECQNIQYDMWEINYKLDILLATEENKTSCLNTPQTKKSPDS